jgi:hypothetical protein
MLRILALLICITATASAQQHPLLHANDTLPDGRREPLNPFLGRVAVYNEWLGASGANFTLNFEFQLIKKELWGLDAVLGLGRLPETGNIQHRFQFPLRVQAQLGRRRSRFLFGGGLTMSIDFDWYEKEWPPPNQCGICPEAPDFAPFLLLGYRLQLERGFFLGINALFSFTQRLGSIKYTGDLTIYPWGGLYFGYRLPSAEQHRLWVDRSFKRRVSREMGLPLEDDDPPKRRTVQPPPIELSPAEAAQMARLAERQELRRLRRERMARLDLRPNGRSLVYVEGFGATGNLSVNYDYSLPLDPNALFLLSGRLGVGGPTLSHNGVTIPIALGFRVMRNYRGGGLSVGAVPVFGPGGAHAYGFIQPELQFHLVKGVVFGVQYQILIDPDKAFLRDSRWPQYGGFLIGYRLPQLRKRAATEAKGR